MNRVGGFLLQRQDNGKRMLTKLLFGESGTHTGEGTGITKFSNYFL